MAQFTYKARRRSGEVVTGVLEMADRGAALLQIERLGLFPIAVEIPKGAAAVAAAAAADRPGTGAKTLNAYLPPAMRAYFERQRKPKLQELATFTNQLANLIKSGMPLTVALNSMAHLETKGIPSDVSRQLKQDVMEGKGLSEAMGKQPVIFSNLYINMVKAGEQSGALVDVLPPHGRPFRAFFRGAEQIQIGHDLSGVRSVRRHCHQCFLHDSDAAELYAIIPGHACAIAPGHAHSHRHERRFSKSGGGSWSRSWRWRRSRSIVFAPRKRAKSRLTSGSSASR